MQDLARRIGSYSLADCDSLHEPMNVVEVVLPGNSPPQSVETEKSTMHRNMRNFVRQRGSTGSLRSVSIKYPVCFNRMLSLGPESVCILLLDIYTHTCIV